MSDQAQKLRSLVEEVAPEFGDIEGGLPLVVVAGGRAGVGTTTVALNLAAVLADRGERVLLIDGAQQRNIVQESAGGRCDIEFGLSDVLAGKCDIDEAIVTGPAGVQMLLNRWSPRMRPDFSRNVQQRLMSDLRSLSDCFDLMIVDAGRGLTTWSQRFWTQARLIALVTTPDDAAVLDAYATLKQAVTDGDQLPVRLLVNQADSLMAADDAHERMETSCQRFLSRSIPALPSLPRHFASDFTTPQAVPRVWEMPNTPFGHAAMWLGRAVNDLLVEELRTLGATAGLSSSAA